MGSRRTARLVRLKPDVAPGQHQVEQDGVELLGGHPEERPFAGALDDVVVALALKSFTQSVGDFRFVLDDENTRGSG